MISDESKDNDLIQLRSELELLIHQIHHLQRSQKELIEYLVEEPSDIICAEALSENYEVITSKIGNARRIREVLLARDLTYRESDDARAFQSFIEWEQIRERESGSIQDSSSISISAEASELSPTSPEPVVQETSVSEEGLYL